MRVLLTRVRTRQMLGVFISFFIGLAHADCSSINLYEDPRSPFLQIPIAEQGPANTCYAHAAAQLADYYLMSHRLASQPQVSEFWVAINHKTTLNSPRHGLHWAPHTLGNSYLYWAIQDLNKNGNCSFEQMKSSLQSLQFDLKIETKLTSDELLFLLELLWPKIGVLKSSDSVGIKNWVNSTSDLRDLNQRLGTKTSEELFHIVKQLLSLSRLNWLKSQHVLAIDFFEKYVFGPCKKQGLRSLGLPAPHSVGLGYESNESLVRTLNQWLELPAKQPVAVGYCAEIYRNKKIAPLASTWTPRALKMMTGGCSAHYSLVVGRRPASGAQSTGQCEYLIRNSQGEDFWSQHWNCLCQNSKTGQMLECKYQPSAPHPQADQTVLGCWVKQADLMPWVYDLERF